MNGIYFIENYIDEYHTGIHGYYPTLDEAKDNMKYCADWYRPNGTGRIYYIEFGRGKTKKLVFESK